ncbi:MAG: hypothetical protein NW226_03415, partial [Microscillaceae bacterium]|nr:hypothetical protein [Microscillaceae bacterium]
FCDQTTLVLDLYIVEPNVYITFIGYEDFYAFFGINLMIFGGFVQVPGTVIYIKTRKPFGCRLSGLSFSSQQPTAFCLRRVDAIYCNSVS